MTGLEILRNPDTTAEEIADIVSLHCPPIIPNLCDSFQCRECWLSWLATGGISQHESKDIERISTPILPMRDVITGDDPYYPRDKRSDRPNMDDISSKAIEARNYVKEVLVGEKGLRLYDISKLIDCSRTTLSRFVNGDCESEWLAGQVLAFKERLEGTVPFDIQSLE